MLPEIKGNPRGLLITKLFLLILEKMPIKLKILVEYVYMKLLDFYAAKTYILERYLNLVVFPTVALKNQSRMN